MVIVAEFEATGVLDAVEDVEGRTEGRIDCTTLDTAEGIGTESDIGSCLRIRLRGFDDALGVPDDTLDA